MENCTEYKRISNFEVLRIISMFMIIFNHFSYNVFWNNNGWLNLSLVNRVFVSSFFPLAGETGVAIFFMLAGYFGIEKNNISVIRVILEIIFLVTNYSTHSYIKTRATATIVQNTN